MALEQFANNAQSTTTGAIDGSTDPVTFGVADSSAFPSSGNFRVLIDSEIFTVTAVAGLNFTATRASESTSIASHLSGATVTHVLTAGGLKRGIGDFHLSGTMASRPTAAVAGRMFFPSDSIIAQIDDGSAWQNIFKGKLLTKPPALSSFTQLNPTGVTYTDTNYGFRIDAPPASADKIVGLKIVKPGSDFTFDSCVHYSPTYLLGFLLAGIFVTDGTKYKCVSLNAIGTDITISVDNFTNDSTFSGNVLRQRIGITDGVWLRIKEQSGTRSVQFSLDGEDYTNVQVDTTTEFLTTSDVGYFCDCNQSTAGVALKVSHHRLF